MVSLKAAAAIFGTALLCHLPPCLAGPIAPKVGLHAPNDGGNLLGRADERTPFLRIMPPGASITAGTNEPPDDKEENGYRKFLRDKLRAENWGVNMVGSFNRGSMNDNVSSYPMTGLVSIL